MPRTFAIGDIHGCSKTFRALLLDKIGIQKSDTIYCLGDYVDRGEDSRAVVDFILELREKGYTIHTLRGNHEQMMMDSGLSSVKYKHWYKNGGNKTLKSFGIKTYYAMQPVYKRFFNATELHADTGKFLFVHAGFNFKNEDIFADEDAMLWIRDFEIDETKLAGRVMVHGHTPMLLEDIVTQSLTGAVNIDGGCYNKLIPGLGHLVALNVTDGEFVVMENVD